MTAQPTLFDRPAPGPFARSGAPKASGEAAAAIEPKLREIQVETLRVIRRAPRTADDVAKLLFPDDAHGFMRVRPRCSELHKAGFLAATEIEDGLSTAGNRATVWTVTAKALDFLDALDAARKAS